MVQGNWWVGNLGEVTAGDLGQTGELRCKSKQEELKSCADFKGEVG